MRRSALPAVLLLSVLLALPVAAHATPTDQVWISGLYDDGDYDDIVLFMIAAVGAVDSAVVNQVGPLVICLGLIAPSKPRSAPLRPLASFSTRDPPARSA